MATTVVSVRLENELLDWMKIEASRRGLALADYLRLMIARGALTMRTEEEIDNVTERVRQKIMEAIEPIIANISGAESGNALTNNVAQGHSVGASELLRETAKRVVVAEQLLVKLYAEKNKLGDVEAARKTGDQVVQEYDGGAEFRPGR